MDANEGIPIGTNILTINNQNLEEAEELEDRKQREAELQNLLSHAMGEFNFDDQSTLNSSVASKEGEESVLFGQRQAAFNEQYREANPDEQLKVLYEVRVREVLALNKEVDKLKEEFTRQEQILKNKVTLLEIENERKNISLKEVQDLLVDKTEQLNNLSQQLEDSKTTMKVLENNISEMNHETMILREENMELRQQLSIMERGFPLANQTADKELREQQRNKIAQLETSLQMMIEQMEHKEYQHKEMVQEFRQSLREKEDCLTENEGLINRLTENFDAAQQQCQDLLKTVEDLRQRQTVSPLGDELRKIREFKEKADILSENVRKEVEEQFKGQIDTLSSENRTVRDMVVVLEHKLEDVNQELQTMRNIQAERNNFKDKLEELQKKFASTEAGRDNILAKQEEYRKKITFLKSERDRLEGELEEFENNFVDTKAENDTLRQQIADLQMYVSKLMQPTTTEKSIQSSFLFPNNSEVDNLVKEKEDMYSKLVTAHDTIDKLESQIQLHVQENEHLKKRECLINKLQDKAAQFEKIIFEKQKKLKEVNRKSIGTNTELCQDEALLKIKYDVLLLQAETKLRKNLNEEFEAKVEKLALEAEQKQKSQVCEGCRELRNENQQLHELRKQDRQAVTKLVDCWIEKFSKLEEESQHNMAELKVVYDKQLISHAVKLEQEYVDRFKKINVNVKKTVQSIDHQKDKIVHSSLQRHNLITERINRIANKIQQGSEEIAAIEIQSFRNITAVEKQL